MNFNVIDSWLNETWYKNIIRTNLKMDSDFIKGYQGLVNFNINRELQSKKDMTSVRDFKYNVKILKNYGFEVLFDDLEYKNIILHKDNRIIFHDNQSMIMFYQYQSDRSLPSYISYKSNYEKYQNVYCGEMDIRLGVITINEYLEQNGEFIPWEFDLFPYDTQLILKYIASISNDCLSDFF